MAEILAPDLCVIGAGSGGLATALGARAHGASVVVIERGAMGGAGLNSGAIPYKALSAAARRAHAVRGASAFGLSVDEPKVNFGRLREHLQEVIAGLAPNDAVVRLEALGIKVIRGEARFIDKRTVAAGDVLVRARRFVIATGASPVLPAIEGLAGVPYFTTETIFENTRRPAHLVVVGAGPKGAELAQAYVRLGSEVTLIEETSPLPGSDPELAEVVLRRLREEGVQIRSGTSVTGISARPNGIAVAIRTGEAEDTINASHILVATMFAPNLAALDLDRAAIWRSKTAPALLRLSPRLRTTNWRVFAAGAAAGGQLAHVAGYQAGLVVQNALFGMAGRYRADRVPVTVDTDPEIAEIGLTEERARERLKTRFRVVRWSFAGNERARTRREGYGLCKLILTPGGRLLGAGVVGPEASELISLFAFAIAKRMRVGDFSAYVAPHPSLSEVAQHLSAEFARDRPQQPWMAAFVALNRLLP